MSQAKIELELLEIVKFAFRQFFSSNKEFVVDVGNCPELTSKFSAELEQSSGVRLKHCDVLSNFADVDEEASEELTGEIDLYGEIGGELSEMFEKWNVSVEFRVRIWGNSPFLSGRKEQVFFNSHDDLVYLALTDEVPTHAVSEIAEAASKISLLSALQM